MTCISVHVCVCVYVNKHKCIYIYIIYIYVYIYICMCVYIYISEDCVWSPQNVIRGLVKSAQLLGNVHNFYETCTILENTGWGL